MDECDGILVAGTSLEVYSAYRFVLHASNINKKYDNENENINGNIDGNSSSVLGDNARGIDYKNTNNLNNNINNNNNIVNGNWNHGSKVPHPIAICNIGETRAERTKLNGIVYKSEANCALLLKTVVDLL